MASKFVIFAAVITFVNAAPFTITSNEYYPNGIEEPSIAYGFGSGISTNFGGIRYSSGIGSSFQSGNNARGYGAGYAGGDDNTYASGIGSAYTGGNEVVYQPVQTSNYNYRVPTFLTNVGSPRYSTDNSGGNGIAFAQSQSSRNFGTAFSSAHSSGGTATSTAFNSGYGTSLSRADSLGPDNSFTTAISQGGGTAVAANHGYGGRGLSTAQASGSQTGTVAFNAPGYQFAHSQSL